MQYEAYIPYWHWCTRIGWILSGTKLGNSVGVYPTGRTRCGRMSLRSNPVLGSCILSLSLSSFFSLCLFLWRVLAHAEIHVFVCFSEGVPGYWLTLRYVRVSVLLVCPLCLLFIYLVLRSFAGKDSVVHYNTLRLVGCIIQWIRLQATISWSSKKHYSNLWGLIISYKGCRKPCTPSKNQTYTRSLPLHARMPTERILHPQRWWQSCRPYDKVPWTQQLGCIVWERVAYDASHIACIVCTRIHRTD